MTENRRPYPVRVDAWEDPPFRLDQGGIDPGPVPARPTPPAPTGMPTAAPYAPPTQEQRAPAVGTGAGVRAQP